MSAGTFTLGGMSSGLPSGYNVLGPLTFAGTVTVGEALTLALSSGDNTITVPTGATAVCVIPPSGNAVAIKVRTSLNSGDGGTSINAGSGFYVHCFPGTAPTTVILNAASSIAGFTSVIFI